MCLTIPLQIKVVKGSMAELSDGRKVSIALIQNPKVGDFVLTNADLAISKVSKKEAKEIKEYLNS